MIAAAKIRAQVSQLEKFNTATNTFRMKFNSLPGDMIPLDASTFGFTTRTGNTGEGDGNGIIEGRGGYEAMGGSYPNYLECGETGLFWNDLSTANLIEGSYLGIGAPPMPNVSGNQMAQYIPSAKIGRFAVVAIIGGGNGNGNPHWTPGHNYYWIRPVGWINAGCVADSQALWSLTPIEAFALDSKIDDG